MVCGDGNEDGGFHGGTHMQNSSRRDRFLSRLEARGLQDTFKAFSVANT
jgi:hypothetical protein